ncbi:cupredoxin domain-containing protein [Candidatus Berkelbacteria bacterium]|nr:cupredoxin domain-containing protein [Candidatus Berkelbacteria bacterium]
MNKYAITAIVLAVIIAAGIGYRAFLLPKSSAPVVTGALREITITAKKDTWSFVPELIDVNRGDKIVLTVVNEDNYDHGIAIDAFGVSQRMPANSTIRVEFVATQEGDFPFYCSVPCGEGVVEGKKRGHFDMVGKLHVRSIASPVQ